MITKFLSLLICMILIAVGIVGADSYRVGQGDVLDINFWQDPSLNSTVRVNQEGKITLDIVGDVEAAGKTTQELENDIVRRMSRLNKNISQAVVRVASYNYQHVFVSGQVNNPGKYTFEEIPDLWTILNEAGGLTETADLSRVTIIRGGEEAGKVEVVNVAEAIATGQLDQLPKIGREDTIEVPRTLAGLPSAELSGPIERKNVIYVVGAVTEPGPVKFEKDVDVLEAIALAGGFNGAADVKKAKVLAKDGYYAQSLHFDLEKYALSGAPARYIMNKEDIVVVPYQERSTWEKIATILTPIGAAAGVITSGVLIYNALNDETSSDLFR